MQTGKKKYLVACSGGPDSMALLDMAKEKYEVSVCHINYHKRESAYRDQKIVENYTHKYHLPFYQFDYVDTTKGNFQDAARVYRYKCFAKVVKENNLDGVLVAHHKDDLLETYILQVQRKSKVDYYGLKSSTTLEGVKVVRPLLKYTKKDLEDYCHKHNIEYGIDESNLTNHYSRNQIRHTKIEKMSLKEKNVLVKEIQNRNKQQQKIDKAVTNFIHKKNHFDYDTFMNFAYSKEVLRKLVSKSLSEKHLDEILLALKSKKNIALQLQNKFIYKEYDYIEIWEKEKNYSYTFKTIPHGKFEYFSCKQKGDSFCGVTLKKEDFPITVRNVQEGDKILMRYGTKKINRFFIDHKISTHERKLWPVLVNKDGIAILVPKIGCDKYHYSTKHNLYMVK